MNIKKTFLAFQIVAGWWGHQPGQPAVGGVSTAHLPFSNIKMNIKKILLLPILVIAVNSCFSQNKKINVYAFVSEDCPISIYMAPSLKSVAEQYATKINFYLVFPLATSTRKTAALFKTQHKLSSFIIKLDSTQAITKKLGAVVTPEVIITGADDAILYKGRINDAYQEPGKRRHIYTGNDLDVALQKVAQGEDVPKPWKKAVGCFITIKK
ncbi:MAG: hypothetical protein ABI594_19180 [Ginsengibacter sp.]